MCDGFWQCEVSGQIATWLTAAGTISVVIAALTSEWWQAKLFGPVLELSFGASPDYQTSTFHTDNHSGKATCTAHYIRVKVFNTRKAVAKSCRAYLIDVEKFNKDENAFESTIYCDSIRLNWSCQGKLDRGTGSLDLPNGVSQFVDVVATRSDHPLFEMQMYPQLNRYAHLFSEKGIFQFTILVTANRVKPKKIRIIFEWTGVWSEFKAYRG